MFNIRITHRTDGVENVVEISDQDIAIALSTTLESRPVSDLRSEELPGEFPRFRDNNDGTVTDTTTGLMWTKHDVGEDRMVHAAAESACKVLELGGHKDWRLPTRAELLTLVDDTRHDPAIDVSAFPSCKSNYYWTGTPAAWNAACAWVVYFSYGSAYDDDRDDTAFVRAVRVPAGQ